MAREEQTNSASVLRESLIEGLPALHAGATAWAQGPHPTCHFVLPGRLIAGSFPGGVSEPEHTQKIQAVIGAGVDTFLCLQEAEELRRFTPYVEIACQLYCAHQDSRHSLEFLHASQPDTSADAEGIRVAVDVLIKKLLEGRTIYAHCWGGHGRTGTLICGFLVKAYGMTVEEARAFFLEGHRCRVSPRGGSWPASNVQREAVQALQGASLELCQDVLDELQPWQMG